MFFRFEVGLLVRKELGTLVDDLVGDEVGGAVAE